jgi:hypothetical protein
MLGRVAILKSLTVLGFVPMVAHAQAQQNDDPVKVKKLTFRSSTELGGSENNANRKNPLMLGFEALAASGIRGTNDLDDPTYFTRFVGDYDLNTGNVTVQGSATVLLSPIMGLGISPEWSNRKMPGAQGTEVDVDHYAFQIPVFLGTNGASKNGGVRGVMIFPVARNLNVSGSVPGEAIRSSAWAFGAQFRGYAIGSRGYFIADCMIASMASCRAEIQTKVVGAMNLIAGGEIHKVPADQARYFANRARLGLSISGGALLPLIGGLTDGSNEK